MSRRITLLTVLYKRINELPHQLDLLSRQTFQGEWDILYWNNNYDQAGAIDAILNDYRKRLTVSVIHSARNYHCMARLALANIAQGDLVFMMDDDVQPTETYLDHFLSAYERSQLAFGNDAVIVTACGHRFGPSASGKTAQQVWEDRTGLEFYDECAPETELNFAHANNLLMSRQLLLQSAAVCMPQPDFALVDDYWLSYVLSRHLGAKLIKIQAAGVFSFSASAFDPNVAMFYRRDVHAARLRFFDHHVRQGWPPGLKPAGESHRAGCD